MFGHSRRTNMDKNLVYKLTYETIVDSLPDFIDLDNDESTKSFVRKKEK